MILSDGSIRKAPEAGRIVLEPLGEDAVQPSSTDIRLDRAFRVFANHRYPHIDTKAHQPELTELVEVGWDEPFILHPGEFALGATYERLTLGDDLVAQLNGKSSLGRLGLMVHATAGFIDPGFSGNVTLELSNVATLPVAIYPGMKIGQFAYFELDRPAESPYGAPGRTSKYQNQAGPTASRSFENFAG